MWCVVIGADPVSESSKNTYIDGDRTAKFAVVISVLLLIAAALVLMQHDGAVATLRSSPLHYAALWVACALMEFAGMYCVYLVVSSIGAGSFPGPKSKLPARFRLSFGAVAIGYRGIMIAAAVHLMAFPFLIIRYVNSF